MFVCYFRFLDIDECASKTDSCDVNAFCNNTVGSHNCTCNRGYSGNGQTCTGKYYTLDVRSRGKQLVCFVVRTCTLLHVCPI